MFRSFIVILSVLSFGGFAYAKVTKGPVAVIEEPSFDFGETKEGTTLEHSFNVTNDGAEMLEITDVKPDCGCTTSVFDRTIPPGQKGRITLKVDTAGFKDKIKKNIRVFTNDSDQKMILLQMEAFIKSSILMSKEYVVFAGAPGEVLSESIDIKAQEKTPLKLEVMEYTLNDKVAFDIQEIEAGKVYKLTFKNKAGQSGIFSGQMRLKTNFPDKPEIFIKIRGRLVDDKG